MNIYIIFIIIILLLLYIIIYNDIGTTLNALILVLDLWICFICYSLNLG